MFYVNTNEPNIPPKSERCTLLRGIDFQRELNFEEIMDITNSPYSNENWSKLSYFVSKGSFRPYSNDDLGRIIKRKFTNRDWVINETSLNCLVNETYLRIPTICDWICHFTFFILDNFVGSLGIYAMQLSKDASDYFAIRQIANIAQYQINSGSPFHRFMIAIDKEDKWELAFGFIVRENLPKRYIKARKVKIHWFKEPSQFFNKLLGRGNAFDLPHEEFVVKVRV